MYRTHTCGELRKKDVKKSVRLTGWNQSRRDHGGIIFIDVRDRYGLTQIVFDPKHKKDVHTSAEHLRREDVIAISGTVRLRGKGLENLKLETGEIEILVDELTILNKAETPPIEIDDRIEVSEDISLKYRYLELRKPRLARNIRVRSEAVKIVRDYFHSNGFLEIETPILAKSTPEGARDYLVPSRVHPGNFYALPQSPQLFKQLCMIAGLDRYFQIARCFRDEDLRADRQPEFTQIDVEMSFIDEEDIHRLMEGMVKEIWKKVLGIDLKTPFRRMLYSEAMAKYGSDKRDLRFGLELVDVTDIVKASGFQVFTKNIAQGGVVKAINAKKAGLSRNDIDGLISFVQAHGAKGMAWMKATEKGLESSVVKYFSEDIQKELKKALQAKPEDLLLFVSDVKESVVHAALGALRLELGKQLNLIRKGYEFVWVTDFPFLEYKEDEGRYEAMHHPFTSPKPEDLSLLESEPRKVRARAYDLALNGVELGGGSIRIHDSAVQKRVFNVLGITDKEAEEKFGFLLSALKYGAPPHGGIAFGVDRLAAMLCGEESIREVIAFPKNKAAQSLMEGSPSPVSEAQLKELGIRLDHIKGKGGSRAIVSQTESAKHDAEMEIYRNMGEIERLQAEKTALETKGEMEHLKSKVERMKENERNRQKDV